MVNTVVALDIGTTHIRGVEAQIKTGSLPKIVKTYSVPLESDIIVSGLIVSEEGLQTALKKLWSEAKFSSKNVISMATGDSYDNRVVADIPWSPPEDFKRLLPHYLRERLPYEIEDYYFDAHTLNEYRKDTETDSQLYKLILVAGVHREFADTLIKCIEATGMRPIGIDILPLALIRAYSSTSEAPEGTTIVSVELGGDITTIVMHKNGQPIYINTATPLGGARISTAIAKELQITMPEAEMLKTGLSLTPEEHKELIVTNFFQDGSTTQTRYLDFSEDKLNSAREIISREVSNIVTHIGDILEDAFNSRVDTPYEIVVSGGGAALVTLIPRLQTELAIATRLSQPFGEETTNKLSPTDLAKQHEYTAIFGLLVGQDEL
jgi:type IV pilus assembly protein PilM